MTRIRNGKSSEPVSPCSVAGSLRRWDGVRQHLWWCSFARIDGECFVGRSPLSQNWRVEIRVTASVFAVTKGRRQLLGGKPTLKIHVPVGEWIIYSYSATLFAELITCTVVVHDASAERLNICWICFDDLVTNKTANVLNTCLEFLLSNCVPWTLGVPRKKFTWRQNLPRLRWHLLRESQFSNHLRVLYQPEEIFQQGAGRRMGCGKERTLSTNETDTTQKQGQDMRKIICMLAHCMSHFFLKITTVKFYHNI